MDCTTSQNRRQLEQLSATDLAQHQLGRLNQLLREILPANRFYANKLASYPDQLESLEQLSELPFTFKDELIGDASETFAANLTYPVDQYVRFHRTSGTRGRPLAVVDTSADWQWWVDTWQFVLDSAGITSADRAFMAFSFGPFIGFWSANDALVARGCMTIPGGGLNTLQRLDLIRTSESTAVFCTPTYALRLAEVAQEHEMDLHDTAVNKIVVAGEPGGSLPGIRQRIESAWQAEVIDHSGASEIGPWGFADQNRQGLHIVESEFIAEFLSLTTGEPATEDECAELVLTTLGRAGCPVIRYRTGDMVRPTWNSDGDCQFVLLQGGVLGRVDDMLIIRGVNIFPSSVEQILRSFPEIVEYRLTANRRGEMDELTVEIEDRLDQPGRVAEEMQIRLGLKVELQSVPIGSLPRFEAKGRRFVDNRLANSEGE